MITPHPTLVEIETDEGITGIGATAAPSYVIAPLIEKGLYSMRSYLIDKDPTETSHLWKILFETWQARNFGRGGEGGLAVNAMSAIDIALWDIVGKARLVPIFKLLGNAIKSKVMVYASAGAYADKEFSEGIYKHKSTEKLVQESKQFVEQGFKAIKFGWGNFYQTEDLESLAAIRAAIGPDIHLRLDFAWMGYLEEGHTFKYAIEIAKTLKPLLSFDWSLSNDGISLIQGAHQVAQKFINKIFPLNLENFIFSSKLFLKDKLETFFLSLTNSKSSNSPIT